MVSELYRVPVLVGLGAILLLVVAVLVVSLARATRRNRELMDELARAVEDAQQLGAPMRRLERELEFITEWLREFPSLMSRLGSCSQLREIPHVLVEGMVKTFQAEQAVVVLRRRSTLRDPERDHNLIVAAVATPEAGLDLGAEIPIGEGQLGIAAASMRASESEPFADDQAAARQPPRHGGHMALDAVAPMVVGDTLVGVVGFARSARNIPNAKDMLNAIAQLGGLALHNLWTYRRARVAADTDGLTGILNKSALRFRFSERVYEAGERGGKVAVFMFDIDHFKNYNDRNGHVAGDEALRLVARLAGESIRADDIFGRFGGEEFLVILPDRSAAEARIAAEAIRSSIGEFHFPFGEGQPTGRLTVSGGVAVYPDNGGDSVDVLKAADEALYRAKNLGRNRIEVAPG